jgi:septum formation protein
MNLLLASSSPRRRDLLERIGLSFATARPDIDETPLPNERPDLYVARLSREKSLAIVNPTQTLILTADTTVADDDLIIGKPVDAAEATATLRSLRGRAHKVYTGVTLRDTQSDAIETTVTTTTVWMRDYTDDEIARYIARGEPFDKAGSYAIHDAEFHPVARIEGCYASVMGLPLCTVSSMLAKYTITLPRPVACDPGESRCEIARAG